MQFPRPNQIPEDIQDRFARVAAAFVIKYGVSQEDVSEFMMDIIQIYEDYLHSDEDNREEN